MKQVCMTLCLINLYQVTCELLYKVDILANVVSLYNVESLAIVDSLANIDILANIDSLAIVLLCDDTFSGSTFSGVVCLAANVANHNHKLAAACDR